MQLTGRKRITIEREGAIRPGLAGAGEAKSSVRKGEEEGSARGRKAAAGINELEKNEEVEGEDWNEKKKKQKRDGIKSGSSRKINSGHPSVIFVAVELNQSLFW